jgi:hypothetical protein
LGQGHLHGLQDSDELRAVDTKQGEMVAAEFKAPFFEASVKTTVVNVDAAVRSLVDRILGNREALAAEAAAKQNKEDAETSSEAVGQDSSELR